jgi:uncharacterized protein YutE (UPF0331/DUF86 family)
MNRIKDKINEIEGYLDDLETILPKNFEEYESNLEKRLACERSFERIIESLVDLAYIFISFKRFPKPTEEKRCFQMLFGKDIIPEELFKRLEDAKGMRNILAHEYGSIDDEMVFDAVINEIKEDAEQFIKYIKKEIS